MAYAVLSFGGFLGMGEDYWQYMPWSTLKYDTNLGGYLINLTKDQLDNAPKFNESRGWVEPRERPSGPRLLSCPALLGISDPENIKLARMRLRQFFAALLRKQRVMLKTSPTPNLDRNNVDLSWNLTRHWCRNISGSRRTTLKPPLLRSAIMRKRYKRNYRLTCGVSTRIVKNPAKGGDFMSLLGAWPVVGWFGRLTSGSRFYLRVHTRVGVLGYS